MEAQMTLCFCSKAQRGILLLRKKPDGTMLRRMNRTARVFAFTSPLAVVLAALVASAACGPNQDNLPPPPPPPPPSPSSLVPPAPTDSAMAMGDAGMQTMATPASPVTLGPGARSPDPDKPTPTVKINAPSKDQVIPQDKANDFIVKLDVKNWATAVGSSHVHLILDNRPYKPIYDPKVPVHLNELTGGEAIAEGQHVLVAFPSRANHESVKTKDALFITQFWVGKKVTATTDLKKPMLIYSRPKGDYKGAMASHIIVDFQLLNTDLTDKKSHVNVTVSGPGADTPLTAKVTEFGPPLYIENARTGSYSIKMELVDNDEKVLPGPWNSTTRTINVDKDAVSDMNMGHAMDDAGAPMAMPMDGGKK